MSLPTATAAVLAYRVLPAGGPMLLGAIALADVRRLLRDPAHLGSRGATARPSRAVAGAELAQAAA
jgi:hypothetical protein